MSTVQSSPFLRAARHIGDFGNPFYEEERHRDVWNEASAFGLQLAVWAALLFSTVCIWLVGRPALPYVQVGFALIGAIGGVTLLYAQRLGVDALQSTRLNRARLVPFTVLFFLLIAGMVTAAGSGASSFERGYATGAAIGALLALAAVAHGIWRTRRAAPQARP